MNNRKIIKGYKTLISPQRFNEDNSINKFKDGIIYTLYSDQFNSLKVGFAENNKVLEKKLSSEALILLDMKKGNEKDLCLLITTLKELGIKYSDNFHFKYSRSLMRHLSILGWPVGRSLYKQRKIKKELVCA
ncbi:LEM domain-containing protein [Prochlorococcus sp. AH-736-N03]|nr:LEM domain-containing protein [Prochlorococcus sp. AH-736-N03]